MIKESTPLTLAEVSDLAGESEKEEKVKQFIKKFIKLSAKDAKQLKEELTKLDLIKLKDEHIVKIADFLPEDAAELIKIVSSVSFDQDEITKILEIVKKY